MRKLLGTTKYAVVGLVCLAVSSLLLQTLLWRESTPTPESSLDALPNHDYIPDILRLQTGGQLGEARELTRFVLRNPDMPGQRAAQRIERELDHELNSFWGRTRRVTSGFVTGSGHSIEELSGGIASDMIVWGDVRDLCKQGYLKATGKKSDPVVAALAGVGLATEMADFADWAPAVLKAFRKTGALSHRFSDFLLMACRRSAKTRKLDGALRSSFTDLRRLTDRTGLARTTSMFRHIDGPADLAVVADVARKNPDAVYLALHSGGKDGLHLVRKLGGSEAGLQQMAQAAKKGPAGIRWLQRGGKARKHVIGARVGVRVLKNLRLGRPQLLVRRIATTHPGLRGALWAIAATLLLAAALAFFRSGKHLLQPARQFPRPQAVS